MKVVEIFRSIDGEGIRAGFPVVFIRLAGCNLRCSYCDTKYSYDGSKYMDRTVDDICREVRRYGCPRVTLTGGEPLIHQDVSDLVDTLLDYNIELNIETNGSVDIEPFLYTSTIITMDYKCPSSGMEDSMLLDNLTLLRSQDVLKFVVGDKHDLDMCLRLKKFTKAQIFISPVFNQIEPADIVQYMLEHDMNDCRIQLQLHKFIWDPEKRGV